MDELTKNKIQMGGAWCAIVYLVTILVGWGLVAGFLPPIKPSASAADIGELFASDYTRIRIGMVVVMFAAGIFIGFAALCTQYISKIEGGPGILTFAMAFGGVGNMVLSFYPAIWWLGAAFRPDRDAELIRMVNDIAWLQLIGGVTIFLPMPIVMVIAGLCDKSAVPIVPRWCAYANGWIVLTIIPDQLIFFFHSGPFSWNGLFGLWIPVTTFGIFFIMNFIVLRKAILRERVHIRETTAASVAVPAN